MPIEETTARTARDSRLNLRTSSKQDSLIRQAAQAKDMTVSEFVLEAATSTAEQVLADRRLFVVSEEAWQAFEAALERPAVHKPALRALLQRDSQLEPPLK